MALPVALTRTVEIVFGSRLATDWIDPFIELNTQIDALKKTLEFVTADAGVAAEKFDLLKTASYNLGLNIAPLGASYAKLLESVKGTNLEGATTDQLFLGISSAAAKLGLSGDAAERALKAVEQIASKGKVSLEEVRGQLGDAIPGAVPLFAQAMGVTVGEFYKLVEQGRVSSDVLIKVAEILTDRYGDASQPVNTLQASFGRLSTSVTNVAVAIGEAGVNNAIKEIVNTAAADLNELAKDINAISTGFRSLKFRIETEDWESAFKIIKTALDNTIGSLGANIPQIGIAQVLIAKVDQEFKNADKSSPNDSFSEFLTTLAQNVPLTGFVVNLSTRVADGIAESLPKDAPSYASRLGAFLQEAASQTPLGTFTTIIQAKVSDAISGLSFSTPKTATDPTAPDPNAILRELDRNYQEPINKAKELARYIEEGNKALKELGSPDRITDINKIVSAIGSLANNPEVNGDQFFGAFNRNLKKIKDDPEGLAGLTLAVKSAFESGKIDADQLAAGYAAIGIASNGTLTAVNLLQTGFENLDKNALTPNTEKVTENARKLTEAKNKADAYQLKLTEIASNEKIKLIEANVKLNIADIQANAQIITGILDSLSASITSSGDVLSSVFGTLGNVNSQFDPRFDIVKNQIEKENTLRTEAFDLQKRVSESQIAYNQARIASLQSGSALVKIDGAGLQPHLEAFMWEILKTIQTRVSQDGLSMLLGATGGGAA